MKKREITNNDLEQLFNNIIEQSPLLNEEQANSLLLNIPKAKSGSAARHFFRNHLNTLIFGAIVLSIVVVTILWVNPGHKTEKTIVQNNRQEIEVAPARTDTVADKPTANIDKEKVQDTAQEDKPLKTSSTKTSSVPIQTDTIKSLTDIYKHFDKQPQLFSIQANRDTTIICKEGTSIKIKANTFISEKTGKEIWGNVQIAIKEYYKISDVILSNLSTTSGNKILETGGMLHITAMADSENCVIKQGRAIEIGFPYSDKKDDMALFNGEWTNDKIDWKLANNTSNAKALVEESIIEEVPAYINTVVEEKAEFPGGEIEFRKYLQNAQYPFSALKDKLEGKVYVQFNVDQFGSTDCITVLRGLNNILDKVAVYLVSEMPVWKPAKQRGRAVIVQYSVAITFALKNSVLTEDEIIQSKVLEEKIKDFKSNSVTRSYLKKDKAVEEFEKKAMDNNFQETNVYEVSRYVFSVTQLGWINCDRFDNNNNPKTNYSILIDEPGKTIVNVIFHRFKAIIPGYAESNRISFKNVPLGEKITIVAIKTVNKKLFLAVKETEISDKEERELDFQPVTIELLKKEMEKLNKLN